MLRDRALALFKSAGRIAAIPLIAVTILSTVRSFSFGLLLLFLLISLFVAATALLMLFGALAVAIWRRQWGSIVPWLAALPIFCLLATPAWMAGDYIHLAVGYPVYIGKFLSGGHKPVSAFWSSEGLVPAGCDRYLLYDPFGQDHVKDGRDGPDYWITTRRLIGGFFIRERCW